MYTKDGIWIYGHKYILTKHKVINITQFYEQLYWVTQNFIININFMNVTLKITLKKWALIATIW